MQSALLLLCSSFLGWGRRLNLPHFLLHWWVPCSTLGVTSVARWGAGLAQRAMNGGACTQGCRLNGGWGRRGTPRAAAVLAGPQETGKPGLCGQVGTPSLGTANFL